MVRSSLSVSLTDIEGNVDVHVDLERQDFVSLMIVTSDGHIVLVLIERVFFVVVLGVGPFVARTTEKYDRSQSARLLPRRPGGRLISA